MNEGDDATLALDRAEVEFGWMVNSPLDGFDAVSYTHLTLPTSVTV